MSQTQYSIARDGTRSFQDFSGPVCRHVELPPKFSRAHVECFQFYGEVFHQDE